MQRIKLSHLLSNNVRSVLSNTAHCFPLSGTSRSVLQCLKCSVFLALVLLLAGLGVLKAQGTAATVAGHVADESGANLPAATVTLTNVNTGVATGGETNAAGVYRIPGLIPGLYRATVTKEGFKSTVQEGLDLHLEDVIALNYTLSVGAVSDSVTIETGALTLETSSPTVSQVIEGRQVEDTPLNGRNSMNLVALTPGVIAQGSTGGAASNNVAGGSTTNSYAFNNYQIAGGFANQSSVYLDGSPLNIIQGHLTSFVIQQDAVQEFRVESSIVNPQYGEFGGGIISFATKSGTNKLHGSLYEYYRNTDFNANTFFNNLTIVNGAKVPRPQYIQSQYGATAGGPIVKDKAFFFVSFEGFRLALGVPNVGHVPTTAELAGNFSADAPIFDPASSKTVNGVTTEQQISCNGVANVVCQPGMAGSGSTIDPTSNVIANVLRYFPAPNTASAGSNINFSQNGKASASNANYDLRGDYNLGTKQKLFARYARLDRTEPGTRYLNNNTGGPTSGYGVGATVQNYAVGDTIVLNSTSVVDIRASYLRYYSYLAPVNANVNLAQFGPFWAAVANQLTFQLFPVATIAGNITAPYSTMSSEGFNPLNNYVLSGTYSKVLGRHSFSFGGEARQREEYYNIDGSASGNFTFAGSATACVPVTGVKVCALTSGTNATASSAPGSGATPIADFIIGTITSAGNGFTDDAFPSAVNHYGGIFANDTFQMSPRMTVTAGLRYELPGGFTEKHNKDTVLLPALANPLVLVASSTYASRSDLSPHLTLLSPRVGFAFQPVAGTSVRAGYSLTYLPADTVSNTAAVGSPINSANTFVTPGSKLSAPLGGTAANPKATIVQPIGRGYANNPAAFAGQTIQGRLPFSRFPYLQQWNATLQQSLPSNAILQLAYLGARGNHLPVNSNIDINQLPDKYDSLGAAGLAAVASPGVSVGQSLRPFSMYQNVNALSPYFGDAYYHSAQVTFNKRFSGGGTLLASYSWSKNLSNSESTNPQVESHPAGLTQDYDNLRGEKSYLSFDVPQHLVISYILDLPVGRGKHFLATSNGVVETLVSGWNASGINTFQSGLPEAITATANVLSTTYGAGTIRPNVVAGCNKRLSGSLVRLAQTSKPTLNAACFTAPAATSFGNQPRTDASIRTQGVDNWDFSVGKTTPIHEDINLVFRAEAFNVFNRVQFGDPALNSSNATFGVITSQVNSPRLFQFSLRLNY